MAASSASSRTPARSDSACAGRGGGGGTQGDSRGTQGKVQEGVARLGSTHLSSSTTAIIHGAPLVVHGGILCLVMHPCPV